MTCSVSVTGHQSKCCASSAQDLFTPVTKYHLNWDIYTLKNTLGCFNPILSQIWTNPAIGLHFINYIFNPMFEFVHIRPKIGLKQLSIFRVYAFFFTF